MRKHIISCTDGVKKNDGPALMALRHEINPIDFQASYAFDAIILLNSILNFSDNRRRGVNNPKAQAMHVVIYTNYSH